MGTHEHTQEPGSSGNKLLNCAACRCLVIFKMHVEVVFQILYNVGVEVSGERTEKVIRSFTLIGHSLPLCGLQSMQAAEATAHAMAMLLTSNRHLFNRAENCAWRRAWIRPLRRSIPGGGIKAQKKKNRYSGDTHTQDLTYVASKKHQVCRILPTDFLICICLTNLCCFHLKDCLKISEDTAFRWFHLCLTLLLNPSASSSPLWACRRFAAWPDDL